MDSNVISNQPIDNQIPNQGIQNQQKNDVLNQQSAFYYPPLKPEEKEAIGQLYKEGEPAVIEKKEFKLPKEVGEYVQEIKKEDEIELPQPIKDEYGEILLESASPTKPKIELPLNQEEFKQGLKKSINDTLRWLAEVCKRIWKMFPGRTFFKKRESLEKEVVNVK